VCTFCSDGSLSAGDVASDCQLPVDVGPCFAYQVRWYHDPSSARCRQFHYGGCQGNANNFFSLDDCQTACTDQPGDDSHTEPNGTNPYCLLTAGRKSLFHFQLPLVPDRNFRPEIFVRFSKNGAVFVCIQGFTAAKIVCI